MKCINTIPCSCLQFAAHHVEHVIGVGRVTRRLRAHCDGIGDVCVGNIWG